MPGPALKLPPLPSDDKIAIPLPAVQRNSRGFPRRQTGSRLLPFGALTKWP